MKEEIPGLVALTDKQKHYVRSKDRCKIKGYFRPHEERQTSSKNPYISKYLSQYNKSHDAKKLHDANFKTIGRLISIKNNQWLQLLHSGYSITLMEAN